MSNIDDDRNVFDQMVEDLELDIGVSIGFYPHTGNKHVFIKWPKHEIGIKFGSKQKADGFLWNISGLLRHVEAAAPCTVKETKGDV